MIVLFINITAINMNIINITAINMQLSPTFYHLHFWICCSTCVWGLFTSNPVSVAILSLLGDSLALIDWTSTNDCPPDSLSFMGSMNADTSGVFSQTSGYIFF